MLLDPTGIPYASFMIDEKIKAQKLTNSCRMKKVSSMQISISVVALKETSIMTLLEDIKDWMFFSCESTGLEGTRLPLQRAATFRSDGIKTISFCRALCRLCTFPDSAAPCRQSVPILTIIFHISAPRIYQGP